jgi:hypothetical protein
MDSKISPFFKDIGFQCQYLLIDNKQNPSRIIMSVFLLTILTAILSFPFSSAVYNNASNHKGNMKMMTEDEWPSHGPWIVTVGTVY